MKVFRIVYNTDTDPRRHTSFLIADVRESDGYIHVYVPDDQRQKFHGINLEHIGVVEQDENAASPVMRDPQPPLRPEYIEYARALIKKIRATPNSPAEAVLVSVYKLLKDLDETLFDFEVEPLTDQMQDRIREYFGDRLDDLMGENGED